MDNQDMTGITQLSESDMQRIYTLAQMEIDRLPKIDENTGVSWRAKALATISSAGAVLTLTVVEFIRSFGIWVLIIGFAWLEYERVSHGAKALGMQTESASTLAIVFVLANLIHPIFALAHIKKADLTVTRHTFRGGLEWLKSRLFDKAHTRNVDNTYNPTLALSALLLTGTTIILALYDVLSPLITSIATQTYTKPMIILMTEFIMGAGMSIAGVLFLQASAHEAGLRALSFDTRSPAEIVAQAKADRQAKIDKIYADTQARYMTAKIADMERKRLAKMGKATTKADEDMNANDDYHHAHNGMTNGKGKVSDFLAVTMNGFHQNGNGNAPKSDG